LVKILVCWGRDKVEQASRQMTANEAAQVTLLCNYSTSFSNAYLFWYKQLPNRSPTFILSEFTVGKGTTEDEFKERFSATLDSTSRTVLMMIEDVRVSDSAVYYCALQPTVTETHSTLIQKQN
uniref:Ig-like domain-containing protein n=1 Tax=Sinocyclocheilus rhinocerous TaxID=307959 RepID=A0A673M3P3_9TELE